MHAPVCISHSLCVQYLTFLCGESNNQQTSRETSTRSSSKKKPPGIPLLNSQNIYLQTLQADRFGACSSPTPAASSTSLFPVR